MNHLSMQGKLNEAFNNKLTFNYDHFVVENSKDQSEEKIRNIILSSSFYPLISENKCNGNFVFSVIPFKYFEPEYLTKKEIEDLFIPNVFSKKDNTKADDRWESVNNNRPWVSSSLTQGLSEIILKNAKDESPIIEIGSGMGYSLSQELDEVIRTQGNLEECKLLNESNLGPIYQLKIEGIYNNLFHTGKKVSLFFALNVFDTLSTNRMKTSLSQISKLQNVGDHLLIMSDTNPCLDVVIKQIEDLYTTCFAFPFFPLEKISAKMSVVMVPKEIFKEKPKRNHLIEIINDAHNGLKKGEPAKLQKSLHFIKEKFNLKVIILEDFFVAQVKNELELTGYKANIYYHTSFKATKTPIGFPKIEEDLIYKAVTDTEIVRLLSLTDEKLINDLSKKGIKLPNYFNEDFQIDLIMNGKKVFAAEILVIEAIKTHSL